MCIWLPGSIKDNMHKHVDFSDYLIDFLLLTRSSALIKRPSDPIEGKRIKLQNLFIAFVTFFKEAPLEMLHF